ncbi:anthranilate n-hydroxycinnamoyl benzoyltransferase [Fusarium pseudocircinatum]|uniref:Anthranilate n-hydroxycinnamoyl benzoyltransferase n=1 Tax=Fusarium pseudocircinatum TaxID=56676 RepID=A0A8H5PKS0_9HYPO|nr:anthranilate n-hydroxycinnamoyl benzoyltransferase [Fusarium pseudocircinatum]
MAALDAAGLALAATQLCYNLANGLYQLINEIKDASKDAEMMQDTLSALHTRLDQVRALFDANVPQSSLEKDCRDSIDRTLENIHRDLRSLTGKLRIDEILEANGSSRLETWSVLQRKFRSDDIRNIKERLAGSEELLQSHFLMLSIYIGYKTQDEVTHFKALLRPILENLLFYATFTEERQRNRIAESRSIRRRQLATDAHGASNILPNDESDWRYHDAFKRWSVKSKDMIMSIADLPWHQVSNSNYVPSIMNESRDGASTVPTIRDSEETTGPCPSSRLGPGLPRVEEIPDEPPEDATQEVIDWCKEQGYPVRASNFRFDLICEMGPGALRGTSPIHQAIKTNNMAVLKKMLSHDCNTEVRSEDGSRDLTPFLLACSELNAPAVKLLLAKGAKADATDRTGKTGLHLCQSSKFEGRRVAKLLLEDSRAMALDVNAQDQFCMTATHIAARVGDVRMLEYLLLDQHGKRVADANAQQQDGSTPLMVALKSNIANKKQVIDVLLRYSDLSVKNKNGEDAKKLAPRETTDINHLKQHLKAALSELSKQFPDSRGRIIQLAEPPGHLAISTNDVNDIPFKFFDQRASFSWTYSQLKSQDFPAHAFVDGSFDLPYRLEDGGEGVPAFEVHLRLIDGGLLLGIYGHHSIFDAGRMDTVIRYFAELTEDPKKRLNITIAAGSSGRAIASTYVQPVQDLKELLSRCPEYRLLTSPLGPTQFRAPKTDRVTKNTGCIFVIQDQTVRHLKDKLASTRLTDSKHQPSTFTCLAAITWAHVTEARIASLASETYLDEDARLMISVDWRRRISSDPITPSSGNAIALPISTVSKSTILAACNEDEETSYTALSAIACVIDKAILSVNDDFVAARTSLFRSVPDPRLIGLDFDLSDPLDFYLNTWRHFGTRTQWDLPGLNKQSSARGIAPDAVRRAQAGFGTGAGLVLPEADAAKFEVLITLDVEAMEHLRNSPSWQRWIEKPGL